MPAAGSPLDRSEGGFPAEEASRPVLAVHGLRFAWDAAGPDILTIDRLELMAGEQVLLRGPSGCGKSSLLALAAGVVLPRSGRVSLLGQDWAALSASARDRRRAGHVGVIFQQFNLLPYLGVLDNVLLPCRFSATRRQRAEQLDGGLVPSAQALLAALQIEPGLWRRRAGTLSVGQQQRVAAARALLGRPELVLADEPTSALDEGRRDAFLAVLGRVCADAGSALLFVSHDPRLATHFDRCVDLGLGRPDAAGSAS